MRVNLGLDPNSPMARSRIMFFEGSAGSMGSTFTKPRILLAISPRHSPGGAGFRLGSVGSAPGFDHGSGLRVAA